ncbi:MAG: hypothetical protein ABMB14_21925 [Myxococcota bacterium]
MTVSWLTLERYAAGDCDPAEASAIEAAIARDDDARTLLGTIVADRRPLPPLPSRAARPARAVGRWWLAAGPSSDRFKGGELAVELVHVRDGASGATREVRVGEPLGLRLTCPPTSRDTAFDVVVFQAGEASFPIPRGTVVCGNRTAVPGAFAVDRPGPLTACVAVAPLPARTALADGEGTVACVDAIAR